MVRSSAVTNQIPVGQRTDRLIRQRNGRRPERRARPSDHRHGEYIGRAQSVGDRDQTDHVSVATFVNVKVTRLQAAPLVNQLMAPVLGSAIRC